MIWDLINSNFLQTLVTLVAGIIAYLVYITQKKDTKKDAANTLLLEIQHAERSVAKVREYVRKGDLNIDVEVLQVNSWANHKHLFSRDFDKNEWDAITDFYNKAQLLDDAIKYNNNGFSGDVEQIRINKQRILAEFTKDTINNLNNLEGETAESILKSYNDKISLFDQLYMEKQGQFAYNPQKPINDAKKYLEDLHPLSTASVGIKLKQLAGN